MNMKTLYRKRCTVGPTYNLKNINQRSKTSKLNTITWRPLPPSRQFEEAGCKVELLEADE